MKKANPAEEAKTFFVHIEEALAAMDSMTAEQRDAIRPFFNLPKDREIEEAQIWGVLPAEAKADKTICRFVRGVVSAGDFYGEATPEGKKAINDVIQTEKRFSKRPPSLDRVFSPFSEAVELHREMSDAEKRAVSCFPNVPEAEQTPTVERYRRTMEDARAAYRSLTAEEQAEADQYLQFFCEWQEPQA